MNNGNTVGQLHQQQASRSSGASDQNMNKLNGGGVPLATQQTHNMQLQQQNITKHQQHHDQQRISHEQVGFFKFLSQLKDSETFFFLL